MYRALEHLRPMNREDLCRRLIRHLIHRLDNLSDLVLG